jgi:hypothetical protein
LMLSSSGWSLCSSNRLQQPPPDVFVTLCSSITYGHDFAALHWNSDYLFASVNSPSHKAHSLQEQSGDVASGICLERLNRTLVNMPDSKIWNLINKVFTYEL